MDAASALARAANARMTGYSLVRVLYCASPGATMSTVVLGWTGRRAAKDLGVLALERAGEARNRLMNRL